MFLPLFSVFVRPLGWQGFSVIRTILNNMALSSALIARSMSNA
jgi:hypothetical protein